MFLFMIVTDEEVTQVQRLADVLAVRFRSGLVAPHQSRTLLR